MIAQALRRRLSPWGHLPAGRNAARAANFAAEGVSLVSDARGVWLGQAARYSVVGLSNTALDAVVYLLLTRWLGLGGAKILAKGLSYTAGTLNSFHWNRSWTFHSRARALTTFLPFVLVSLASLAVNALMMYVGLAIFGQQELPALALATGTTLSLNFLAGKFLVFRR